MTRKRFNERQVLEVLAWQGAVSHCFRCHQPFLEILRAVVTNEIIGVGWLRAPEREHLHEYKLGGADEPYNCRYSCSVCHSIITNGTKATSAGSSKQRLAKVNRLRGETKPKRGAKIQSPGFQKGHRPIAPRPFQKRQP